MEILKISNDDVKDLKKIDLSDTINNSESNIFIYKRSELLKLFKNTNDIENKFYVLNKLFYIKENLNLDEIVLPNKLVKVDNRPAGYLMDYIKSNTNIGLILQKIGISFEDKKFLLMEIANILKKIENNKTLNKINFHLGDIHEFNFIYDNKENMVRAIDIDSAYVDGSDAPISKFLTYNEKLWDLDTKYPFIEDKLRRLTKQIPNKNTTIISYIYMLLNVLTGEYSPDFSGKKFCEILNMLSACGINKELLDSIYNIYLPKDNYINYELVNSITEKQYIDFKLLQLKNVKK